MQPDEILKRLRGLLGFQVVYDIAVALRGPDYVADRLKYVFTARLRWLAGVDVFSADTRCEEKVALTHVEEAALEAREWFKKTRTGFRHWLEHMYTALNSMQLLLVRTGGHVDAVRELEEMKQLLLYIRDYAYEHMNMKELEEKAKQLNIVEP